MQRDDTKAAPTKSARVTGNPMGQKMIKLGHSKSTVNRILTMPKHLVSLVWNVGDKAPNDYSYNAAITACGNGRRWDLALVLLEENALCMKSLLKNREVATRHHLTRFFVWSGVVRIELRLSGQGPQDCQFCGLRIHAVPTFQSTLVSAHPDESKDMRAQKERPGAVAHNAAITACEKSGQWVVALCLLQEARKAKVANVSGPASTVRYASSPSERA
eukprot:4412673-Amphidinium_carterae.1